MRTLFAIAIVLVTAACAAPDAAQEAAARCAAVGISARDPDFGTCTKAYVLEAEQAELGSNYRQIEDTVTPPRRFWH